MLDLSDHPGRIYVLATALPLVPVLLMLAAAVVRHLGGWQLRPLRLGGILSVACLVGSAALAGWGAVTYFHDAEHLTAAEVDDRWSEHVEWVRIGAARTDTPGHSLHLGYRIDQLSALMYSMVTGIGSLIFLFSLGYMKDELKEKVEDHGERGRKGRFGQFFLYLSLFAFSMLSLLIADNLFQIFVGWELVGLCSFFLIGFYFEKKAASDAANKAFLINRVGDAGFLVGIAIAFTSFGTLNVRELIAQFEGGHVGIEHGLWIAMGLGLFLGAVGKSAQVPLQTWLPDAMEGPTPVSALIHAATMVAAGVYLVGRCYPLFSPEVLTVIAYVGLVTLVVSAATAVVMTDIKRVLAFSTCSQLGYMMLALGVGGWTAGLLHLLTHAFFKALLFLGVGSVIHGLHHEQDLRRMGGLRRNMPVTAYTMLVGVLAISGAPFFSGWYSKDMILAAGLGYSLADMRHLLLFLGPLLTAGLTAFYMFRLWFLAFAGEPRDRHVYDHAHESPWVMTLPLVVLAALSVGVAWGWPVWDAEASYLGRLLHHGQPHAHGYRFEQAHDLAEKNHLLAGGLALLAATVGGVSAWVRFGRAAPTPDQLAEPTGVFAERWYFDAVYDRLFVRTGIFTAQVTAAIDRTSSDDKPTTGDFTLDGAMNATATVAGGVGGWLRRLQTGRIRGYVLVLAVAVIGLIGILTLLRR